MIYEDDLAYVHEAGFGDYARRAAPEIARLLRQRAARSRSPSRLPPLVVEIGCGGGTLARHLVEQGYRVLGIDQSPAMIRMAQRNVPAATFKTGSLATTSIPRCRAIVAIGEVVSYITDQKATTKTRRHEEDLSRFFVRAARALEPGGLLVFDFMESAEGRTYAAKSRAGADWAIVTRARASGRLLTRDIVTFRKVGRVYRRSRETHNVRLYSRRRIATLLTRAGFSVTMRRSIGRVPLIRGDVAAIAEVQ